MTLAILAAICAGLFAGAAAYITLVEHPARLACGTRAAIAEFAPSYRRAARMQAPLAVAGTVFAWGGWLATVDGWLLFAGLLLGAIVAYTVVLMLPTNRRLLDPGLDAGSAEAAALLGRWGRMHAVRTAAGALAFAVLVWRLGSV